jgi:hypothetical protein
MGKIRQSTKNGKRLKILGILKRLNLPQAIIRERNRLEGMGYPPPYGVALCLGVQEGIVSPFY